MIKNRSAKDYPTNAGYAIKDVYRPIVQPDGSIVLEAYEKIDLQAEIDSHFDECDMTAIVNRLMQGDLSDFQRSNPLYMDTTVFPKTYAEMLQLQIDVDHYFASLPTEVKETYGYDRNKFFAAIGSDEWFKVLNLSNSAAAAADPEEGVSE